MSKVNFEKKSQKILYYPGMGCYDTLSNVRSIICQVVTFKRFKTKEKRYFGKPHAAQTLNTINM